MLAGPVRGFIPAAMYVWSISAMCSTATTTATAPPNESERPRGKAAATVKRRNPSISDQKFSRGSSYPAGCPCSQRHPPHAPTRSWRPHTQTTAIMHEFERGYSRRDDPSAAFERQGWAEDRSEWWWRLTARRARAGRRPAPSDRTC